MFVTDTLGDLREAKKLGVPTIAVDYGYHTRWLKKGTPYTIVSEFSALANVIDAMN